MINVNVIFFFLTDVGIASCKKCKIREGKPKTETESTEAKQKRETKRKGMYRKMLYGV